MKDKRLFYDSIAGDFDALMNPFDVGRRLDVVFERLLAGELAGLSLLDVGCGTGRFSQRARHCGAEVVALDIGTGLAHMTAAKAGVRAVAGDALSLPFRDNSFDVVVSSETIEHTTSPAAAVGEMARVLKAGGRLALTCPNKLWLGPVRLASALGLRPFAGYENFPSFGELEAMVSAGGLAVKQHLGLHPWPFQIRPLWWLSRRIDERFGTGPWARAMINQAILATKP